MRQLKTGNVGKIYLYIPLFFFILLYHVRSTIRFAVHSKRYITCYQRIKTHTVLLGYLFGKKMSPESGLV